jgi:ABC-type lipoprotein release transport system permease subunit
MRRALLVHALGALARRGGRNAAIVVGLAFVVFAFGTVLFASEGLRAMTERFAEHAPALTVQRLAAGRATTMRERDAEPLRTIPSVRAVRPRVWGYYYLAALEANVTIVAIDDAETLGLADLGATLADGEAVFGPGVARALGLQAGDRIALGVLPSEGDAPPQPRFLRVAAVLGEDTAMLASDLVLTTASDARAFLGMQDDEVTDLAVDVFPPEESAVVAAAVIDALPNARVVERESLARGFELTFDARAGLLAATLLPTLLALLLLAWDRLTGLSDEERREIGVLKAIGWSTRDVLESRLVESGLVALAGAILGVVLAYVHAFVLGAPLLVPALLGWSNVRPALVIAPATDPLELAMILAAVLVPFAGVSIVPAWRAANVDPDRLLR